MHGKHAATAEVAPANRRSSSRDTNESGMIVIAQADAEQHPCNRCKVMAPHDNSIIIIVINCSQFLPVPFQIKPFEGLQVQSPETT